VSDELKLRDYQEDAITAVFKAWSEDMTRPAIVLPPGAGKTVVFSALIKKSRRAQEHPAGPMRVYPGVGRRVIVLVHRDELADQAMAKIHSVAPELTVGKVKASVRQVNADVMVCSVQTLARGTAVNQIKVSEAFHGPVGLIITDECHHAAAPSYRQVFAQFPDALQLGVTATMARGDGGGLGDVWEEVVYSRSILWMMSRGYLSPVTTRQIQLKELDMSGVKTTRGDYAAGDLGRAMIEAEADRAIPRAYKEHAGNRPGIIFTPTVATAQATADAMTLAGIRTAVVSGETEKEERHRIYDDFRHGRVQVLVNCMVLTEGFDAPWAEVAVIARPTKSTPLYTQMVGRVLRPWPGKESALVLDLVGASANKIKTLIDLEPGMVKRIKEGETLEEAVLREEEEAEAAGEVPARPGSILFDLKHRDVDMFSASDMVWLQTRAGILFIEAGGCIISLFRSLENPTLMDVVGYRQGDGLPTRHSEHRNLDLPTAMAWGEVVAEELTGHSLAKSASWRRKPASPGQIQLAEAFGINVTGMKCGAVSDAISVTKASDVMDQWAEWA